MRKCKMQSENKYSFDMASDAKFMPCFGRGDRKDVIIWLRYCSLVAETAMFTEEITLSVMKLTLDGKARSWASKVLQSKITTRTKFTEMIKNRFHKTKPQHITLSRVFNTNQVINPDEFFQLLKGAIHLFERNLLKTISLV